MPALPEKDLVIFDLDNTLTDTLKFWGTATCEAVELMVEQFSLDKATTIDAIQRAPSQYRFADFGALVEWLDAEKILPAARNPAEQYSKDITKTYLRQMWFARQSQMTVLYDGALETMRAIKANKTAVAIYTDGEASAVIRRLWLLAYNARRQKHITHEEEFAGLFDHIYCQPSIEDDFSILRDVDADFVHDLKRRMTLWQDRVYKPSTDHTLIILNDFQTRAERTLMVGDTAKDGGSARPLQMDFAWYKAGACADEHTVRTAKAIASPKFQYGLEAVKAQFTHNSGPTHVAIDSLKEILPQFTFVPGQPFSGQDHSGRSLPAYHRNAADPAAQTPAAKRVWPDFHAHTRDMPLGPATHLTTTPQAPGPANPSDTADQGTPVQPKPPMPV